MNEIARYEPGQLEQSQPMSMAQLKERMVLIKDAMTSVMKDGEDYGAIPGCGDKPTLFEPGAEKLICLFRFVPRYDYTTIELPGGHREYRVKCTLYAPDGTCIGEGLGSASTLETKWRFRAENSGRPVPSDYWKSRDPELLGGAQFSAKKNKDGWVIMHKVEHDNPADYYNTCLKMGAKRAKVATTRQSTGASFLFSQDLEDEDIRRGVEQPEPPQQPHYQRPQPRQEQPPEQGRYAPEDYPQQSQQPAPARGAVSEAQVKRLFAISKSANVSQDAIHQHLESAYQIGSANEIKSRADYDAICAWVQSGGAGAAQA